MDNLKKSKKGIGGHQSAHMKTDNWLTPPEIIKALGRFDLDPCTPEAMPRKTAHKMLSKKDDGLTCDWSGRVWLNPPYGNEAEKWLNKLADHGDGISLIFARTETRSFFKEVWGKASALLFIEGRLHFHDINGVKASANAGAPSVLVAYGQNNADCLRNCTIQGAFVLLTPQATVVEKI